MRTSRRPWALNIYEVLTGACRLYFDIDKSTFDEFFDALSWMTTTFPTDTWRIFYRAGDHRQSFHVIGSSTYPSPMAMGHVIRSNHPPPILDMAVYTRNRCWKVPFSRKFGKGSPMLPFGGDGTELLSLRDLTAVADAPCDPPGPPGPPAHPAPPAPPGPPGPPGPPAHPAPPGGPGPTLPRSIQRKLEAIYGEFYSIAHHNAGSFRLSARSKVCRIAGREHSRNHIFVIYDPTLQRHAQSCYNERCGNQPLTWVAI